jgi:hypothetical protein
MVASLAVEGPMSVVSTEIRQCWLWQAPHATVHMPCPVVMSCPVPSESERRQWTGLTQVAKYPARPWLVVVLSVVTNRLVCVVTELEWQSWM